VLRTIPSHKVTSNQPTNAVIVTASAIYISNFDVNPAPSNGFFYAFMVKSMVWILVCSTWSREFFGQQPMKTYLRLPARWMSYTPCNDLQSILATVKYILAWEGIMMPSGLRKF
jgi:hypothetical protein